MNNKLKGGNTVRLIPYVLGVAVLWSLLIAIALIWNMKIVKTGTLDAARIEARTAFDKDVIYRRWNASHGGVYVTVNEKTRPNPYLDVPERDIITPSGKRLTKVNPAYMTRQVHEIALQAHGVKGHITSLNPIRPANAPDVWEAQALKGFQAGGKEFSSGEQMDGRDYMRLMRPLFTESGCLKCHAAQGYKLGDIRGGISVAIPMAPLQAIERFHIIKFSTILGLLWVVGLTGIGFSSRRIFQQLHVRKQMEKVLEFERAQLFSIFNSIDEIIYVSDPHTYEILFANKKLKNAFQKELTGGICYKEFQGVDSPCEFCTNEIIFKNDGKPYQWEYHNPTLGHDFLITDRMIKWPDDRDVRFEIAIDITDQKRAEDALQTSHDELEARVEERNAELVIATEELREEVTERKRAEEDILQQKEFLNNVLESLTHPFYVIDANDYTIKMANSAVGMGAIEENSTCYALTHKRNKPCDGAEHICPLENVQQTKKSVIVEHIHYDKEGNPKNLEVCGFPIFDEQGNVSQMIEYSLDITERKRTEKMLKASEEQYRDLYDNAPCAYFSVSATDGTIIQCNDKSQRMLGYEKEALMQMKIFDLYSDSPNGKSKALEVFKSFKTVGSVEGAELEMKHKDGSSIWIALSITSVLDNAGNVIRSRSTAIDISQRKRLESQLRQRQKVEAIGVFAGGIAHDFNTLLGTMMGYGDMLRDAAGEGSVPYKYVEELMDAGYHARDLIKQLLDFARPSKEKKEPLELSVIIDESIKMLRSSLPATITIKPNIMAKSGTIDCDATQIQQVIMNLGINASWAIGNKMGEIGISLTEVEAGQDLACLYPIESGSYLCLTVSDTGCGIDNGIIEHIFDPFYTTKEIGEGSGLGLSVVHGIIKNHGGFVAVESKPKKGSAFHVYLPKIED